MSTRSLQLAITLSAAMVAIGVFLPLTSLPVYGDVNYNGIAGMESYIVIAFALSAPILLFLGKSRFALVSAIGIWLTLLFPAIRGLFTSRDQGILGDLVDSAAGVMQDFAADLFLTVAEFAWGGIIFLLGLLVLSVSCAMQFAKLK